MFFALKIAHDFINIGCSVQGTYNLAYNIHLYDTETWLV